MRSTFLIAAIAINDFRDISYKSIFSGPKQEVDSVILKWERKSRRFEVFQTITTIGAYDWTYFSVQDYHFLAVAQAFNGKTTLMESVIYILQKDKFLPFQTLEVSYARYSHVFSGVIYQHNHNN